MRLHRIIFFAAIVTVTVGCGVSKKDVKSAKSSLYDTDFATVYGAALEATRDSYPNLEDAPGRGAIKTQWHQVSSASNGDDPTRNKVVGASAASASQASAGMPTRMSMKRQFIRFDISINGGRPWRLKVVGHAADWEPGAALPSELHGASRPPWLEGRTDELLVAIHNKIKSFAVPMKEGTTADDDGDRDPKKSDPSVYKDVPPDAAKRLASLKDAIAARDYPALRGQLADDVLWSLGGGAGADGAIAMWQADPATLDEMTKVLLGACGGDSKRVSCPAGPPAAGEFQLVIEPRVDRWRVTSFVKAE
ncbi:MAG TPA: hypothetical protein VGC42_12790 [Kofleriaceae bacterium]